MADDTGDLLALLNKELDFLLPQHGASALAAEVCVSRFSNMAEL